jgi:hypothetical protein
MISLLVMPGTTRRGACVSPMTLQSIPGERVRFTDQLAHSLAQRRAFFRVATVPVVSIALAKRTTSASATSVHSTPWSAMNGRRLAGLARPGFSPAAPRLAQSCWLCTWVVHRVVCHFSALPFHLRPVHDPNNALGPRVDMNVPNLEGLAVSTTVTIQRLD